MKSVLALGIIALSSLLLADSLDYRVEGTAFGAVTRVTAIPTSAQCLCLEGQTLFCGAGHAVYVLDVTNPLVPKVRGVAHGVGRPRQLVYHKGYVYLAARETGVWVIDVRDLDHPQVVTRFDTIELATGIDAAGDVLFVGQRQNGVEFIDITDPAHPAHIRIEKTSESQSVVYRDGWLYSGDWGMGEITVIDAHDMATVKKVSLTPLTGFGDGVSLFGKYLFASTGHHAFDPNRKIGDRFQRPQPGDPAFGAGHGLTILDVSNPAQPNVVSRVSFGKLYTLGNDFWTSRPSADGQTVFAADTHNGLYAVDYAKSSAPQVIGHIYVPTPEHVKKGLPGSCVSYVAVGNGAVYFTALDAGLSVVAAPRAQSVKVEKGIAPINASFRITYPTVADARFTVWQPAIRAQARGAAVYGDYLYAACGAAGLFILQANAAGVLYEVKRLKPPFAGDVKVKGNRLYSAEGLEGLAVYDLTDPLNPKEIRRCSNFGVVANCALWVWAPKGKYVVVSNRENGYIWLDEDFNPVFKCCRSPGWDRYLANDVVGAGFIGMSHGNTGFSWIDQRGENPKARLASPRKPGTGGINGGCCVFRGDRLLRVSATHLQYFAPDASDTPDHPFVDVDLKRCKGGTVVPYGQPAWDGANRLAVTTRIGRKIWMIDLTDEQHPRTLWEESPTGQPDTALYYKGRLVVPCGYQGVLMEKSK